MSNNHNYLKAEMPEEIINDPLELKCYSVDPMLVWNDQGDPTKKYKVLFQFDDNPPQQMGMLNGGESYTIEMIATNDCNVLEFHDGDRRFKIMLQKEQL